MEITDEEQSQRGLHRGSGSEKQRCRHGARWLNLFTGAVIAVLVMLSVILTASVLYPDISGDLIVEVLIGGSLLAIFVFLVVDGLRRRRCFREEPVDRSTRVTWRMPPLGELTKAKPTSGEEDLAHRAAPLPRRRGWVGAGSHRSARGERQWLRPRGVRTMALSPRIQVLVSFILVKACLMAAEWLLRGARALRHRGLLGLARGRGGSAVVPSPHPRGDADVAARAGAAAITAAGVMRQILAAILARVTDGVRPIAHAGMRDARSAITFRGTAK